MSISMDDRRSWPTKVTRRFTAYAQFVSPVPVDTMEVYRLGWDDKSWAAMRYLRQENSACLTESASFNVFFSDNRTGRSDCPHICFRLPKKYPDVEINFSDLPKDYQRKLSSWAREVVGWKSLRDELTERLNAVFGNPQLLGHKWRPRRRTDLDPCCNTPRQLQRVWPELQPFFQTDWKDACRVAAMKVREPYKLGYPLRKITGDPSHSDYCTPAQFRCEAPGTPKGVIERWDQINTILTMMALAEDVRIDNMYPSVHGNINDYI
jgi:hypothetical protein